MDNTEEFKCLSLCTGYAGIELGLKRAVPALRTVAYVEVEAFACANLVSKMEQGLLDAAPVWTDIKTFNGRPFYKRVHIVTAGYPCQGESTAGKRKGQADPRWLWPYIERIIEAVRPVWFFGENVAGHLTLGFPTVYRSLRNLGYSVETGLFTAAECGAPHRRQRLFILAYNTDSGCQTMQIQQKRESTFRESCRGLADTECTEQGKGIKQETSPEIGGDRLAISSMADTKIQRTQRNVAEGTAQTRGQTDQYGEILWPARPAQPQYEWEEPRVVDNADWGRCKSEEGQVQTGRAGVKYTDKGQTQSRLGRAVDGTPCRVDRLRLLGNGVVPQQAEKAFRELKRLFE